MLAWIRSNCLSRDSVQSRIVRQLYTAGVLTRYPSLATGSVLIPCQGVPLLHVWTLLTREHLDGRTAWQRPTDSRPPVRGPVDCCLTETAWTWSMYCTLHCSSYICKHWPAYMFYEPNFFNWMGFEFQRILKKEEWWMIKELLILKESVITVSLITGWFDPIGEKHLIQGFILHRRNFDIKIIELVPK